MGKDEGKLMYPCSLTADHDGNLYIVDEGTNNTKTMKIKTCNTSIILNNLPQEIKEYRSFAVMEL